MNVLEAQEHWVRTGGIELCVAELGDTAQPTVVLVHGYPDSKEVWSRVAHRLAGQWHVVLYDVRGHGRSTAPTPLRGGFTLEKLTDDFLAVADAVSPDRPVHVVGHDWYQPSRTLPAHSASKAAVLMLSECLRAELAERSIGVSAICPGIVNTNITTTARFAGTDAAEELRRRKRTSRLYGLRNYPPAKVADAILKAVVRNQAVVPVTPEARGARLLSRISPGVLRGIARLKPQL